MVLRHEGNEPGLTLRFVSVQDGKSTFEFQNEQGRGTVEGLFFPERASFRITYLDANGNRDRNNPPRDYFGDPTNTGYAGTWKNYQERLWPNKFTLEIRKQDARKPKVPVVLVCGPQDPDDDE
ncbi:MAG: hypothetical protein ABIA93_05705 [Candidatus Woesearchaeota archaeon]